MKDLVDNLDSLLGLVEVKRSHGSYIPKQKGPLKEGEQKVFDVLTDAYQGTDTISKYSGLSDCQVRKLLNDLVGKGLAEHKPKVIRFVRHRWNRPDQAHMRSGWRKARK